MARINANLVHDMRMPLQLIYSCAQMIQNELEDPGHPAGKYAQMLMTSVRDLNCMLENALNEKHPEPSQFAREDLAMRTRELCARCRLSAESKGLKLIFSSNISCLKTALDSEKYTRILMNLISNAMRFTAPGGVIRVHLRAMGDFAEISVIDNGCGIAPDQLPYIFERGQTEGGHGLGLDIAQEYAETMGGTLKAESTPGVGSAFILRIPVKSIAAG